MEGHLATAQSRDRDVTEPMPKKLNSLRRLSETVPVSAVVDVGVRESTVELIRTFPQQRHYLFEPAAEFHSVIETNYRGMDYELFRVALADVSRTDYLVVTSLQRNGIATHSRVVSAPVSVDGVWILECAPITVRRFDEMDFGARIEDNFLVKVDVDGRDLDVIRGFGNELSRASVVVIECTCVTAGQRIGLLEQRGFRMIDLVDLVYYGRSLYQFDAIFVRKDLIGPDICPPIQPFDRARWKPYRC